MSGPKPHSVVRAPHGPIEARWETFDRDVSMCLWFMDVHGSWEAWESWIQDLVSFCRCSWLIGVGDLLIEDA